MSVQSAFRAAGVAASVAAREAPLAEAAMVEFDITSQRRAAAFLAQVLHESGLLQWFEELASGQAYEGRRDLGNTRPGDGRRFKGRGPIQLTGRANYTWASRELDVDLVANPRRAAEHKIGWRIAGLYWRSRGLNGLADQGAFDAITRRINGGTNGWQHRRQLWAIVKRHDCRPRDRWAGYPDDERRWITEYDRLLKLGADKRRRLVLRYYMRRRAKSLAAATRKRGKATAAETRRLASLRQRS